MVLEYRVIGGRRRSSRCLAEGACQSPRPSKMHCKPSPIALSRLASPPIDLLSPPSLLTLTNTRTTMSLRLVARRLPTATAAFTRPFTTSLGRPALPPSTDPAAQPSATGPPGHTASPDPWPLPFTPEHIASTSPSKPTNPDEIELKMEPIDRTYETDLEVTKKRLVYQARKRGMLEGDLLLATFARDNLGRMSAAEVKEFDEVTSLSYSLVARASAGGSLRSDFVLWADTTDSRSSLSLIQLMDENDWDIFYWAVNRKEPPPRWADSELLEKSVLASFPSGPVCPAPGFQGAARLAARARSRSEIDDAAADDDGPTFC